MILIVNFLLKNVYIWRYASIHVWQSFYEIRETIVFRGGGTYLRPVTIPLLSANRIVAFAKTRQHCWKLDELAGSPTFINFQRLNYIV